MLDENEVRQMILNMVRNGLEAMEPGGTVTISTAVRENGTMMFIKDQGRGIDPQYQENIGTPFVSSKENGTGLGLALVKQMALAHGGKVYAISKLGQGSTFTLKLPLNVHEKLIISP